MIRVTIVIDNPNDNRIEVEEESPFTSDSIETLAERAVARAKAAVEALDD